MDQTFYKICDECSKYSKNDITYHAASNNHIECLIGAHEKGYPWNLKTTYIAAFHGNYQCLKYAYENGCPWEFNTTIVAALNGHQDCLEYCYSVGHRIYEPCFIYRNESDTNVHCIRYVKDHEIRTLFTFSNLIHHIKNIIN